MDEEIVEYRCPNCGLENEVDVQVRVTVTLRYDEDYEQCSVSEDSFRETPTPDAGDPASCGECRHKGVLADWIVEEE